MNRIRAALRTNEPQQTAVIGLTVLNLGVCASREYGTPWWLWVFCLLFWPTIAVIHNLFDPLPEQSSQENDA